MAVYLACFRDYTPYLAAGEIATVAIIASTGCRRAPSSGYTLGLLEAVPVLQKMVKDDTADQIVLNNRVVIEIHTAIFRVTRGYTLAAVLCDETAYWRDDVLLRTLRLIIDPIAGARVRARRKWPVSGESGRVHDPIATRPKHDLQRDR